MITKIVLLLIICLLLVADYAMLVVASRSEQRADEMYRKWKENKDEQMD